MSTWIVRSALVNPDAFQRLQQVDEATFLNELIHLINKEKAHELFYRAFGTWMARDSNAEQEDAMDGNYNPLPKIKQLCMEASKTPRDIGF
jgi:hypothetical protein